MKTLVSARANRLETNTFKNLEELEKYAEDTVSNVYYLILEGSKVQNVHADHAASHLGKAQGIVQQLRLESLTFCFVTSATAMCVKLSKACICLKVSIVTLQINRVSMVTL